MAVFKGEIGGGYGISGGTPGQPAGERPTSAVVARPGAGSRPSGEQGRPVVGTSSAARSSAEPVRPPLQALRVEGIQTAAHGNPETKLKVTAPAGEPTDATASSSSGSASDAGRVDIFAAVPTQSGREGDPQEGEEPAQTMDGDGSGRPPVPPRNEGPRQGVQAAETQKDKNDEGTDAAGGRGGRDDVPQTANEDHEEPERSEPGDEEEAVFGKVGSGKSDALKQYLSDAIRPVPPPVFGNLPTRFILPSDSTASDAYQRMGGDQTTTGEPHNAPWPTIADLLASAYEGSADTGHNDAKDNVLKYLNLLKRENRNEINAGDPKQPEASGEDEVNSIPPAGEVDFTEMLRTMRGRGVFFIEGNQDPERDPRTAQAGESSGQSADAHETEAVSREEAASFDYVPSPAMETILGMARDQSPEHFERMLDANDREKEARLDEGGNGESSGKEGGQENEPKVNIVITRSPDDLAKWRKAAEYAGGTTIEELSGDDATVQEFVAARDPEAYPGVDIEAKAREALQSGATMIRVTEDPQWRRAHPGDVYNYHHGLVTGSIKEPGQTD